MRSARVIGTPTVRIMARHVLRNATRSLPLLVTLNAAEAILTLSALGFLGFGIEPSAAAEWGYDLNRSVSDVSTGIWWTSLFPGAAIVLMVLGVTLVGESLQDLADPRLRTRRRTDSEAPQATASAPVSGGGGPGSARIAATSSVMSMPTGHQVRHRPQPTQPDVPNWSIQEESLWVIHCR